MALVRDIMETDIVTIRSDASVSVMKSLADLKQLLDLFPDAALAVDAAGRILLVNDRVEHLLGFGRSELEGKSIETLVPEQFRPAHREHRARYLAAAVTGPMAWGRQLRGVSPIFS